jgi:hypothetical protein
MPRVHGMIQQLSTSGDWQTVYNNKQPFSTYNARCGDLVFWDKTLHFRNYTGRPTTTLHLEHAGVIGKDGEIMYAGSDATGGYAESDFKAMCAAPTFQPPSVIFRSKHLSR